MIRSSWARVANDRGNTGIAVIVAAPFLILFMSVLISAQQYFDATRQAQAISSEAARIGAQPDQTSPRSADFLNEEWTISQTAKDDAEAYVEKHEGASLSSPLAPGDEPLSVVAEVEIDVDYLLDVPGLPDKARVDSTAKVLRGVEEGL